MYTLRLTFKSLNNINNLKEKLLKLNLLNNFKKIKIKGLYQIKKKKKIFTVLKSPHVNKKSREHFIYKNYVKKIDIKFNNLIELFNFLIVIKKMLTENLIIKTKIIKN